MTKSLKNGDGSKWGLGYNVGATHAAQYAGAIAPYGWRLIELNKDGTSPRANLQANRWNKEPENNGRYKPRVVVQVPAGPGARQYILEWEQQNAARLRRELDPVRHSRP
jgi:hypothetical protein